MKTCNIKTLTRCAVLLAVGGSILSATQIINLGTGQSPGTVGTASDPIWMITSAPSGNTSGPAVLIGDPIWGAAPAGLHWIATDPLPADSGGSQYAAGTYIYDAKFSGSSGILQFSIKADNAVNVFLNSNLILSWGDPAGNLSTGWATFSPLTTITTGFLPINTLELRVTNNSIYTGVLLQGTFEAPEPAAPVFVISGLGLLVLGSRRRTAKMKPGLKCGVAAALLGLGLTSLGSASTVYTNDPTLSDFTSTVSSYGTFISGRQSTLGNLSSSTTYTPTTATLLAANYPRVSGGALAGNVTVIVQFGSATSTILAFDNIDHAGYAWDVFQYKILGCTATGSACNADTGSNYTALFDPQSVNEPDNPGFNAAFTLNTFTGTAPTVLNNKLTPGLGSTVGNIGYEEYFSFGNAYSYFEFVPSTLTLHASTGENELELSAVGIATPSQTILSTATPEPVSALFIGTGLVLVAAGRRWRKAAR